MAEGAEAILFEAVTMPPAGLSARGMRWLCGLVAMLATLPATLFALLGAWPVLGFIGGEVFVVLGLVALHRRRCRAAVEKVMLTAERLVVTRDNGSGRRERAVLDPYWARLDLEERHGAVPLLTARARGRSVEIGRFLPAEEKRALADALGSALRHYRNPIFDNPQLR